MDGFSKTYFNHKESNDLKEKALRYREPEQ